MNMNFDYIALYGEACCDIDWLIYLAFWCFGYQPRELGIVTLGMIYIGLSCKMKYQRCTYFIIDIISPLRARLLLDLPSAFFSDIQ